MGKGELNLPESKNAPEKKGKIIKKRRGRTMAVMRIQSIKVASSLASALKHRLSPPDYEELVLSKLSHEGGLDFVKLFNEFRRVEKNQIKRYEEFFRIAESKAYRHKIRKNSSIYEVVIAYSDDDLRNCKDVMQYLKEDYENFLNVFKEKFGFKPFHTLFIHKDKRSGRYHMHILFSLMRPDLSKKVRWNSKVYFQIAQQIAKRSERIKISERKRAGNYPLWLIRSFESLLGVQRAKELVRLSRRKGLKAYDLIDLLRALRDGGVSFDDVVEKLKGEEREKNKETQSLADAVNTSLAEAKTETEKEKKEELERVFSLFRNAFKPKSC